MHVGSWRIGRPLYAVATVLGMTLACAACASGPSKISPDAASVQPCMLASQGEAQSILGSNVGTPQQRPPECFYASASGRVSLGINIGTPAGESMQVLLALTSNPVPVPSVGHSAKCGPYVSNPAEFDLFAIIDGNHELEVQFGPSCSVDAQFAKVALSHLTTG